MSVATFDPTLAVVQVTEKAERHFAKQLELQHATAVRLSVKESGCTGFAYVLEMVNEAKANDIPMKPPSGIAFFVDPTAVSIIQGTVIDFVMQGVNAVIEYRNPNVIDSCGCGESFSIK